METFETPPGSDRKEQTLVGRSLAVQEPAETPLSQQAASFQGATAIPSLNEPSRGRIGLGFDLEEAQGPEIDVSNGKDRIFGDAETKETEKEIGFGVDSGKEAQQGLVFDFHAEGIERNGIVNTVEDPQFMEETIRDADKAELKSGGISLIDVNGGKPAFEVEVENVADLGKNGDNHTANRDLFGKVNPTVPRTGTMRGAGDAEKKDTDEEGHQFQAGDFVWGKIRGRPWWPGRIYSSSDASDYALKYRQRDCLLVVYFGDGSFSWCYPSQLEPFMETYESMSKQSDSKNFVDALQEAVSAIGRSVESEMICSCIREKNELSFPKHLVANDAIKGEVLVPERGLGKFSVAQFEPLDLIADLNNMAQIGFADNMLEFTVLRSRLSVFYQARGGYQLSIYCTPQPIPGLEDKDRVPMMGNDSFMNVSIEGPLEEDWLSSPAGPGYGLTSQSSLKKCLKISEDKQYQRRKRKSMAELLEEVADIELANGGHEMFHEGTQSVKMASASMTKLRADNGETEIHGPNKPASSVKRGRRKKVESSEIGHSGEKGEMKKSRGRKRKGSGVGNNSGQAIEGTDEGALLNEWEKKQDCSSEIDIFESGDTKPGNNETLFCRERKKSKYLSPPYTADLKHLFEHSISKSDSQTEMVEVSDVSTGPLSGSASSMKRGDEAILNQRLSNEYGVGHDAMESPISEAWKLGEEQIIDMKDTMAPSNEVLSELRFAAIGIRGTKGTNYLDTVKGFFSVYRSSIYHDGSYYKVYHKSRRGRKRKSLHPEPISVSKNTSQTASHSGEGKTGSSGLNKKKEARLKMSNLKRAPVASDVKTDDKTDRISASSAVLFVSFPPAVSLPSRDDLIAIYSKFGTVNEMETDMIYNSFSGRIVFARTADAEQAFNHSVKSSPFGAAGVSFRLRYPSAPPRIDEVNEDFHTKAPSLSSKGSLALEIPPATEPSVKEASQLNFIKQKLELMSSMLENSDNNMSPAMQSHLQGEMKGLLEKVSAMAKSSGLVG